MMKRKLRTHFYNLHNPQPSLDTYHEIYCKFTQEIHCEVTHKLEGSYSITLTASASMYSKQKVCGEFII